MSNISFGLSLQAPPHLPPPPSLPLRKDIINLEPHELDLFVRALNHIQNLPAENENSFFKISGFHGQPFRGAGYTNPQWWGGYCNHGNVLFPTWHRAYLLRLEKALQSIGPEYANVTIPYWNEISDDTANNGIPSVLLQRTYTFADGSPPIPNPLYSYILSASVHDTAIGDGDNYSKPKGYETVRFPFSGLKSGDFAAQAEDYNQSLARMTDAEINAALNDNVHRWIFDQSLVNSDYNTILTGEKQNYLQCLDAPNYTCFSNTTSMQKWNYECDDKGLPEVMSLERPHNGVHLAVGGFHIPGQINRDVADYSLANGDMGENNTAAFDPIFYLHHCFIDLVFWVWQCRQRQQHQLDIIPEYPGTNSVDSQGPTPGVPGNVWLTVDSPLAPFKNPNTGAFMTSKVTIEPNLHISSYAI